MGRLFIIGNGFDLAHGLPTNFNPNFKRITESMEQIPHFWEIYQTNNIDIWSDFENCLACPDFNSLEEIFNGYQPDFYSERESDRDAIITQVDLNGNLKSSLYEFAYQAECAIDNVNAINKYCNLFEQEDLFVNFNYTHTLERVYGVPKTQVLHIHGEVGMDNLLLGYPEGDYNPEKYSYDITQRGRDPYALVDIEEHIESMLRDGVFDYYTYTAYKCLIEKAKSFKKEAQINTVKGFINEEDIAEIYVVGHSCTIDFPYFEYLNSRFPIASWIFNPYDEVDEENIKKMISNIGIANTN